MMPASQVVPGVVVTRCFACPAPSPIPINIHALATRPPPDCTTVTVKTHIPLNSSSTVFPVACTPLCRPSRYWWSQLKYFPYTRYSRQLQIYPFDST
ncbi:hypothetical protein PENSPDRAFT_45275 [Peniophora sp. CONT]|nr:hypothetical protein PENSPDRAFT_45275 [Peniophora sp. CONT]